MLGSGLVFSTLFQIFGYLNISHQFKLYGESTVYWPWAGSGVFWWAVFTIPLAFALIAVLPNLRMLFRDFTPQSSLAVQAVFISLLSYLQLGVKSSPAVATVTISFAAVMVGMYKPNSLFTRLRINSLMKFSCSIILVVLSVRFFHPSYFLTNGIGWPKTVEKSLIQCHLSDTGSSQLIIFEVGDLVQSENLPCNSLNIWDKWFY
jgi:hypothetical protein